MGIKILAVAAIFLYPAVALGQERADTAAAQDTQKQEAQPTPQTDTAKQEVTTETARGEVEPAGAEVTEAMRKGQQDPNIIGSPAWWSTRATADGKPRKGGRQ